MPTWDIHDQWAQTMGISKSVSTYINRLIDFPEKDMDYLDFCSAITQWSDFYRERKSAWPFKASGLRDISGLETHLRQMRQERLSG
jgi:hypothetical protein